MRTAAIFLGVFLLAGSSAQAEVNIATAWKKFKGQIIASDAAIPSDYGSEKEMYAALKKATKANITKAADAEGWTIYFVGFFNKKPGAKAVSLVFYDVSGKRSYVGNKEIQIDPNSQTLVADVEVSEDDGIKKGGRYEVVLGRKVGGKEIVFAKTKLTFK
jgi:hypothetical protein